jgi:amidophosphoribosyltransferase
MFSLTRQIQVATDAYFERLNGIQQRVNLLLDREMGDQGDPHNRAALDDFSPRASAEARKAAEAQMGDYIFAKALQHRGQESAGLVAVDDGRLRRHAAMGLVSDAFNRETLARLPGVTAIGHVRYSTSGSSELRNAQPFVFEYAGGQLAIAHNGNIVNANELRAELDASGSIFQTSSDTEVIVHLMAKAREPDVLGKLIAALRRVRGAYSLVLLTHDAKMIGVRDPNGFRPLVIGRLKDAFVLSSETCSLRLRPVWILSATLPARSLSLRMTRVWTSSSVASW